MRKIVKQVYLPRYWNKERVNNKKEIRQLTYVMKGSKTRGGQQELGTFITEYDEDMVEARARFYEEQPFTHALTLVPCPSVDIMSLRYKIGLFIDRRNRKKKKMEVRNEMLWHRGTTPYNLLIEFGEMFGGIHAHVLISTPLDVKTLEDEWLAINATSDRQLAVVRDLSNVQDKYKMIRYYTLMEEVYSSLVDTHNTEHALFLCVYHFRKMFK